MEEIDWDIYEIFEEQLQIQLVHIYKHIAFLQDNSHVEDSLNELFRYFHNYKASSSYLELTPLYNLTAKAETVLGSLRESKKPVQESIRDWLSEVTEQMEKYADEMSIKQTVLSELPPNLLDKIKITTQYVKPQEKLKTLSILYIDKNKARAKKVVPILKKYAKSVAYSSYANSNEKAIDVTPYNIIVTNMDKENQSVIDLYKEDIPIIAIFDKIDALYEKELAKNGVSHTIESPLSVSKIERELLSVVKIFYSSAHIIIDHKKIHNFIQTLKPLPNTVFQIMQVCDDPEIPVADLIKTVKTDPIISANILKVANSPIYGSSNLKTIDQAVTRFGKQAIKALTMCGVYKSLGDIDLSAYDITETEFSDTSKKRLSLMVKWYSKVSIADLSILSTTALLANIGQLLISKELVSIHKVDKFQKLYEEFNITYAEETILHTTTNDISSQILRYWKLDPQIVDVIEYTNNPETAPDALKKLCAANLIVCSLVNIKGDVLREIPDELLPLLADYNFNPDPLNKALSQID